MPIADPRAWMDRIETLVQQINDDLWTWWCAAQHGDNLDEATAREALERAVDALELHVRAGLETSGLPDLLRHMGEALHGPDGAVTATFWNGEEGEPYSPRRDTLRRYADTVATIGGFLGIATSGRQALDSVLRRLRQIQMESNSQALAYPSKELDVQQAVKLLLIAAFGQGNVTSGPSFPGSLKSFKADLGVRSIRAAIEVKFCDTKKKAGSIVNELAADIAGYAPNVDWSVFRAVIYQTDQYMQEDDIRAQLSTTIGDRDWDFIVVQGPPDRASAPAAGEEALPPDVSDQSACPPDTAPPNPL